MGSDDHYPEERPTRTARVAPFAIDVYLVTNRQFAAFVAATGYVTVAERPLDPRHYPGVDATDLVPGSLVFRMTEGPVDLREFRNWWGWVPQASWHRPLGPGSSLEGLEDHPVVHVAYPDAIAYARWVGRRLPSEAEWEYAARGGLDGARFEWGDEDDQETAPRINTWQGTFPYENTELDGWTRTSPVGFYEPNGYGLHDMTGNVWEWTSSPFYEHPFPESRSRCCGPPRGEILAEPPGSGPVPARAIRGGSHLCTVQYCFRYRPAARQPQTIDTSTSHIGFRCASPGTGTAGDHQPTGRIAPR